MSFLRTGSLGLDILMEGGWKPGTINEIWGEPGSGKTTLAEHATWELEGDQFAFWMSLGTEVPHRKSNIVYGAPKNAELAFDLMIESAHHGVALIVVDSANGLVRQRELDEDPDYVPHPQREYREELNVLKEACKGSGTIVLFLSKPRDRDRQPVRGTGISEKAKARVKLSIWHGHQDETREIIARLPHGEAHFVIRPGTGIDWATELFRLGVKYELIKNHGSWYDMDGTQVQGIKQGALFLTENPRVAVDLDDAIRSFIGI